MHTWVKASFFVCMSGRRVLAEIIVGRVMYVCAETLLGFSVHDAFSLSCISDFPGDLHSSAGFFAHHTGRAFVPGYCILKGQLGNMSAYILI